MGKLYQKTNVIYTKVGIKIQYTTLLPMIHSIYSLTGYILQEVKR